MQYPSPLELEYAKDAHPSHPGWDDVRNSDGRELEETAPSAAKPTVYVYPLPHNLTGAHLYANLTANDHNFHFAGEYIFWQTLREFTGQERKSFLGFVWGRARCDDVIIAQPRL